MKYKGISNCISTFSKAKTVSRKKQNFLAYTIVYMLVFMSFTLPLINTFNVSNFIKRVTSNWTPKTEDFGKIKFVNFSFNNKSSDGVFMVNSPFKNYFAQNITDTCLMVSGLGDVMVLSPIKGKIQSIVFNNGLCNISIINQNVIVNLLDLDYPCVSEGDSINAQDKIAVSMSSKIRFSILCDGEYIVLPAGECGDTFFE